LSHVVIGRLHASAGRWSSARPGCPRQPKIPPAPRGRNRFANSERARLLREGIARARAPGERLVLLPRLADELLKAGRTEEAIAVARPLLDPPPGLELDAPSAAETLSFLGVCYLRQGTQDNCLIGPGAESCLLPFGPGGIYHVQHAPRMAMEQFTALLRERPDDLGTRWLLNLAAMTLGEYPAGVPAAWRVPPAVFASEGDPGRFPNVAPRARAALLGHAGGAVMDDFDGDGLLDLVVSSMGLRDPLRFLRNRGDGTFDDRSREAGLEGLTGGLNLVHADYDNDGRLDLLVLRGGWMQAGGRSPNSLLRNLGGGRFEDVTEKAGLLSFHPTQTAAWADYDGDGFLDLFIGNESAPEDPHPSELYRNEGDGTFTDRSADLGEPDLGYVKGVAWGDVNNDGRPDLYVSALEGDNHLFRNDGPKGNGWRFTDVARAAGVLGPRSSFAVWFWDHDNDGWLDLLVAGYRITDIGDVAALYLGETPRTEMPRLFRNNRDGTFTDVTRRARLDRVALPMGCAFGDLDNDGYPDAYFGTGAPDFSMLLPNRLFRNAGGAVFEDVTSSAHVGHLQKGHGVAFGDLDNDGDQDIFEEMGGWYEGDVAYSVLYRNPGHGNRWITLRLEGRRSSRSALGARIRVRLRTAEGPRDIHAVVGSGGSFAGSSLQQEIGLGRATAIEAVEIAWPAPGSTQAFRDVEMDRAYAVVEGAPSLRPLTIVKVPL
jgi:hypothetical protein